jgi:hypothetical protein
MTYCIKMIIGAKLNYLQLIAILYSIQTHKIMNCYDDLERNNFWKSN